MPQQVTQADLDQYALLQNKPTEQLTPEESDVVGRVLEYLQAQSAAPTDHNSVGTIDANGGSVPATVANTGPQTTLPLINQTSTNAPGATTDANTPVDAPVPNLSAPPSGNPLNQSEIDLLGRLNADKRRNGGTLPAEDLAEYQRLLQRYEQSGGIGSSLSESDLRAIAGGERTNPSVTAEQAQQELRRRYYSPENQAYRDAVGDQSYQNALANGTNMFDFLTLQNNAGTGLGGYPGAGLGGYPGATSGFGSSPYVATSGGGGGVPFGPGSPQAGSINQAAANGATNTLGLPPGSTGADSIPTSGSDDVLPFNDNFGTANFNDTSQTGGVTDLGAGGPITSGQPSTGPGSTSGPGGVNTPQVADNLMYAFQDADNLSDQINERRYADILAGYNQRTQFGMGELAGLGEQQRYDANRIYDQLAADQLQNRTQRGLANTTIASSDMRGVAEDRSRALARVEEGLARERVNVGSALSGDTLAFMERRNDIGPNEQAYQDLLYQLGQSGFAQGTPAGLPQGNAGASGATQGTYGTAGYTGIPQAGTGPQTGAGTPQAGTGAYQTPTAQSAIGQMPPNQYAQGQAFVPGAVNTSQYAQGQAFVPSAQAPGGETGASQAYQPSVAEVRAQSDALMSQQQQPVANQQRATGPRVATGTGGSQFISQDEQGRPIYSDGSFVRAQDRDGYTPLTSDSGMMSAAGPVQQQSMPHQSVQPNYGTGTYNAVASAPQPAYAGQAHKPEAAPSGNLTMMAPVNQQPQFTASPAFQEPQNYPTYQTGMNWGDPSARAAQAQQLQQQYMQQPKTNFVQSGTSRGGYRT